MSLCSAGLLLVAADALGLYVDLSQPAPRRPAGGGLPSHWSHVQGYTLHDFARDFGRDYVPGTSEWAQRERAFRANKEKLIKVLSTPSLTWTPGVTMFMDYSESEYSRLLGYRGRRQRRTHSAAAPADAGKPAASLLDVRFPASYSVGTGGDLASLVRDQGACGSCWAEASVSTLETHLQRNATLMSELSGILGDAIPTVSSQALVSCVQNPQHCGGGGGCDGATAELAYDMAKSRGLPLAASYPYSSGGGSSGHCDESRFGSAKIMVTGYTTLPSNRLAPLKDALVSNGASVVVSVDATNWNYYSSGIYSDANGDFTVNHAVTLMGYQEPSASSLGYWLIKNSWGTSFGENGYIRIEMRADEESHCGADNDTHIGLACDGDPDTAWVCGTCGILYDSTYPTGPYIKY